MQWVHTNGTDIQNKMMDDKRLANWRNSRQFLKRYFLLTQPSDEPACVIECRCMQRQKSQVFPFWSCDLWPVQQTQMVIGDVWKDEKWKLNRVLISELYFLDVFLKCNSQLYFSKLKKRKPNRVLVSDQGFDQRWIMHTPAGQGGAKLPSNLQIEFFSSYHPLTKKSSCIFILRRCFHV